MNREIKLVFVDVYRWSRANNYEPTESEVQMLRDATKNVRVFALGGMFGTSALVFATIQRMLPTMAKV